ARPARIAIDAILGVEPLVGWEAIGPDQARIRGEHQRRIGEPGMRPDLRCAETATAQGFDIGRLRHAIVLEERMDTDGWGRRPFAIKAVGYRLHLRLIAAMVAKEH